MRQDYKIVKTGYTLTNASRVMTVAEIKEHLRITHTADDNYLQILIYAAISIVEMRLNRSICIAVGSMYLDRFPYYEDKVEPSRQLGIRIPFPPSSCTALSYMNTAGVNTALVLNTDFKNYVPATDFEGIVLPIVNTSGVITRGVWPSTLDIPDAITLTLAFSESVLDPSGVATTKGIYGPIKLAMYLMIANWYENREEIVVGTIVAKLPKSVDSLLAPFKLFHF